MTIAKQNHRPPRMKKGSASPDANPSKLTPVEAELYQRSYRSQGEQMAGKPCNLCDQPTGDDATVCTTCAGNAHTALRALTHHGLADDLDVMLAKQTRFGGRSENRPTKASEAPMPCDLRATEARDVLRSTLVTWTRMIHSDVYSTPPPTVPGPICRRACTHSSCQSIADSRRGGLPADTLPAIAAWLARYVEWLRRAVYGAEALDEITAAVRQALRAVDRPVERVYAGSCPNCGAGVYGPQDRLWVACRTEGCPGGVEDPKKARLHRARRAEGAAVTASEAALALKGLGAKAVTPRWIRELVADGRLTPVTTDPIRVRLSDIINKFASENTPESRRHDLDRLPQSAP